MLRVYQEYMLTLVSLLNCQQWIAYALTLVSTANLRRWYL